MPLLPVKNKETIIFEQLKTLWPLFVDEVQLSLKATEPLRGDSLLFANHSPGVPGAHLSTVMG